MEVFWQVVLLVAGGLIGVLFTRWADRWFNSFDDYELWIDITARPLTLGKKTSEQSGLEYVVHGQKMSDPHRVTLYMWRMGKKDVRPDAFGGSDFTVRVGSAVAPTSVSANENTGGADVSFETDEPAVRIRPSLVRPSFATRYDFIADGLPEVQTHNPVADLKTSSFFGEQMHRNIIGRVLVALGVLSVLAAFVSIFVFGSIYNSDREANEWAARWAAVTFPLLIGGFASLMIGSIISPRRARIAKRQIRSRLGKSALREPQIYDITQNPFAPKRSLPENTGDPA